MAPAAKTLPGRSALERSRAVHSAAMSFSPVRQPKPRLGPLPVRQTNPRLLPLPVRKPNPRLRPLPVRQTNPRLRPLPVRQPNPSLRPLSTRLPNAGRRRRGACAQKVGRLPVGRVDVWRAPACAFRPSAPYPYGRQTPDFVPYRRYGGQTQATARQRSGACSQRRLPTRWVMGPPRKPKRYARALLSSAQPRPLQQAGRPHRRGRCAAVRRGAQAPADVALQNVRVCIGR